MKTVLVTGAMGTVGNYVVSLAETAGYRVIVSDRERRGLRAPVRGEIRAADIRDPSVLPALVKGCDAVIHTAAQLSVSADAAELAKTNSDAVAALYEAAAAAGASRFVHVSTATMYESPSRGPLKEDHPLAPRGPYGLSKHGAEAFLRGRDRGRGPAFTILRAAPIYGRRGRHFAASMLAYAPLQALVSPVVYRPTGGPLGTMVHAEDVARAALFVLSRDDTAYETYNVSDGDVMTLGDRLGTTIDAYGLKSVSVGSLSPDVWRFLGTFFGRAGVHRMSDASAVALWKLVAKRHDLKLALRPHLDREAMSLLYDDLVVDAGKLRALGWAPRYGRFAEAWADVLKWYQAERWVPRYE